MVFADTGAELPETYFILPQLARQINKKLYVVCGGTFFQWLVQYGFLLPSPFARWCTRILKQKPLDAFSKDMHMGIRADEPRRQHGKSYPLVEAGYGKKEVVELCRKYDLLNAVYSWRSNVSCFCCVFQRKYDWLGLLKYHPSLFALAEQWEQESIKGSRFGWNDTWTLTKLRTMDKAQIKLWPEVEEEPCPICTI